MRLSTAVEESFEAHTFPTTTPELIEAHGEVELELPNGDETLAEVLGRLPAETLETVEDARLSTYSALGEAAIGRKGYSDRDPVCPGEDGPEQLSL